MGDARGAVAAFRQATRRDRRNAQAYWALGRALMTLGDLAAAGLALRVATSIAPRHGEANLALARILSRHGRYEEALEFASTATSAMAHAPDALYEHARILSLLGRNEDAMASLEAIVHQWPEHLDAAIALAQKHLADGAREMAVRVVRQATAAIPSAFEREPGVDELERWLDLCELLIEAGELDTALRLIAQAEANRGRIEAASAITPRLHILHCRIHLERGQTEDALGRANLALASDPGLAAAHLQLGLIQRRLGNLELSTAALLRAAALAPGNQTIQQRLESVLAERRAQKSSTDAPTSGTFTGDLSIFSLPELLELLMHRRANGRVRLSSGGYVGSIDVLDGQVLRVSAPTQCSFRTFLSQYPNVDEDLVNNVIEALGIVASNGDERKVEKDGTQRSLTDDNGDGGGDNQDRETAIKGALLASEGLDPELLERAILDHACGALAELLSWQTGELTFIAHDKPPHCPRSELLIDVRYLLMETMRRSDEASRPRSGAREQTLDEY
ncbi:MAG: tetratricopeptide repeat protein [Deltaproteobacteria bacterium]|nr:tetratricopeptide repeat protein [Deltaproteobacteria bacterium]